MKPRSLVSIVLVVLASTAHAQVSAVDDAGATVVLARPAQRVVTLAPSATEMAFAAGAGERVLAVVEGSDWPSAARTRPRIGDAQGIDIERVVALAPDLVLSWPYTAPAKVALLRARGIAVFILDPRSIDDIASGLRRIGTLTGSDAVADAAARDLTARAAALRDRYRMRPPITVFYEVWNQPLVTLGGRHIVELAIEECGGRNAFARLPGPAPTVTIEAVLEAAPEAIVAGADGGRRPGWLDEWRKWPGLPAVRYDNLDVVDADLLHRPGPRFVDGIAELCAALDRARERRTRVLSPR